MTLDELKVDSYSVKVNENELTDVKGGSSWYCFIANLLINSYDPNATYADGSNYYTY